MHFGSVSLAASLLALAAPALAADASDDGQICADRPSKANATCTVPAGHFQIESDLINWTRDEQDGVRTDTILYTSPTLKYGVSDSADLQLNFTPYEEVRTRAGGVTDRVGGFGDLYLRYKQRLTASDAKLQIDVLPFVKLPTAGHDVGNGKVEGGLAVPIGLNLPDGFALTLGPEGDLLVDQDGSGRHFALVNEINLGKQLGKTVALTAELWGMQDFDPGGTVSQYSADAALAWTPKPSLQLDLGANFGLNRDTPDLQLYAGIATRF